MPADDAKIDKDQISVVNYFIYLFLIYLFNTLFNVNVYNS